MKIPEPPPPFNLGLFFDDPQKARRILSLVQNPLISRHYLHWDKLRHHKIEGFTAEEMWMVAKLHRSGNLKPTPLLDKNGKPFVLGIPEIIQENLHKIDLRAGGGLSIGNPIMNRQTRDKYLVRSLMEEAITSSQLEGAATTREAAREMIRSGRRPRDTGEQMILNNYKTMQRIRGLKDQPLTPEMVFDIHKRVTEKTLEEKYADGAGRFRREDERIEVGGDFDPVVYHSPPPAGELSQRLASMCDFANGKTPDYFVHPVARAIILHFWLAYDHPFVDGNGRSARALFYWAMLRANYWLFEFISISAILRKAPIKYGRSFLYTETDDNDLTYFIVAQTKVILQALDELHAYIDRKDREAAELESEVRGLIFFNHRQAGLLRHALKHPHAHYTIASHKESHNVVYQTARTDLLDLLKRGLFERTWVGKEMRFTSTKDLIEKLRKLGKRA